MTTLLSLAHVLFFLALIRSISAASLLKRHADIPRECTGTAGSSKVTGPYACAVFRGGSCAQFCSGVMKRRLQNGYSEINPSHEQTASLVAMCFSKCCAAQIAMATRAGSTGTAKVHAIIYAALSGGKKSADFRLFKTFVFENKCPKPRNGELVVCPALQQHSSCWLCEWSPTACPTRCPPNR